MTAGLDGVAAAPPKLRARVRLGRPGEPPAPPAAARPARRGVLAAVVVLLLLAAGLVAFRGPLLSGAFSTAMPTSPGLEERWGVRFTQVGMSADGGMVDVRYVVLDADKAASLAATIPNTPVLVEEASKRTIFAVAMRAHAHDLHVGGRYYLLYRNTGGLLSPGRRVTISVGGEELQHVPVLGTKKP